MKKSQTEEENYINMRTIVEQSFLHNKEKPKNGERKIEKNLKKLSRKTPKTRPETFFSLDQQKKLKTLPLHSIIVPFFYLSKAIPKQNKN